ncbi:hypothetical protein [Pseudactinotalea terrae]|uniref:hypothetical protein n=1 Tax=Pseudactinotalea terrae TaxID=1743262 RepID=UPI0012E1125C|nr:hypothetical protein [Pseudactinotalea terrae]
MRRPSWRDPRLGVGILLVVASVALGSWAVSSADATVEVYQTDAVLTPGDAIDVDDLQVVQVRLDGVEDLYLVPGADLSGAVVTRTVSAGELVPLASVGSADALELRPVQIAMPAAMQDIVTAGSLVELWVAMPDPGASTQATLLPPELLVDDVEVREVHADTSVFAGSDTVQVQVLVSSDDLPVVLAALTAEGQITVVPVLGGGVG